MNATEARQTDGRVWLALPSSQEKTAKSLGAQQDPVSRAWFAEQKSVEALRPWTVHQNHTFENEDRTFGENRGLYIDLVPATTWTNNVRKALSGSSWAAVARVCRARATMKCETCGATLDRSKAAWTADTSRTFQLHCHERWSFDEQTGIQKLERLVSICYECHAATHMGRSRALGVGELATSHFARVTGLSSRGVEREVSNAFSVWSERSKRRWDVDLSFMTPVADNSEIKQGYRRNFV